MNIKKILSILVLALSVFSISCLESITAAVETLSEEATKFLDIVANCNNFIVEDGVSGANPPSSFAFSNEGKNFEIVIKGINNSNGNSTSQENRTYNLTFDSMKSENQGTYSGDGATATVNVAQQGSYSISMVLPNEHCLYDSGQYWNDVYFNFE